MRSEIIPVSNFTHRGFYAGFAIIAVLWFVSAGCTAEPEQAQRETSAMTEIQLPAPEKSGPVSIEETLQQRRSIRTYSSDALSLEQISKLLWAAQGVTDGRGLRTAPSAGATYPLETYLVVGAVEGLQAGIYLYDPAEHSLSMVVDGDKRSELAAAALGQRYVAQAPVNIVFAAVYERTARRYGQRARRYVYMEVGHAAQNVCLQAVALDLGTVVIGAFNDQDVGRILNLPNDQEPLYIIPVGKQAR